MTKKETIAIMAMLKASYPRYYADMGAEDVETAINLWYTMLKEYDGKIVGQAVKSVIATSKYPPTVAEVLEKIKLITGKEEMTEMEAWSYISKAVSNSTYHALEEWEKLPEQLQKVVSPDLLRSWAVIEGDDVQTVIQSNFLRTFRAKEKRRKDIESLPSSAKDLMLECSKRFDMNAIEAKQPETGLTAPYFNQNISRHIIYRSEEETL